MLFSRIQNLHISQTPYSLPFFINLFSRIQNLHISQTNPTITDVEFEFSRIQNLHISQTKSVNNNTTNGLVEFKIYISLKHLFSS